MAPWANLSDRAIRLAHAGDAEYPLCTGRGHWVPDWKQTSRPLPDPTDAGPRPIFSAHEVVRTFVPGPARISASRARCFKGFSTDPLQILSDAGQTQQGDLDVIVALGLEGSIDIPADLEPTRPRQFESSFHRGFAHCLSLSRSGGPGRLYSRQRLPYNRAWLTLEMNCCACSNGH